MTTRKGLYSTAMGSAVILACVLTSSCRSAEPQADRSERHVLDDAAITARIRSKLAADGAINPFAIDVTTVQGTVTLQGHVDEEAARERADRYARETDGVKRVINLVKVGER